MSYVQTLLILIKGKTNFLQIHVMGRPLTLIWNILEMLEIAGFRKWHLHLNSLGRPLR